MSGGVDSSVTAALLVEAGYRAVGFTLKLWDGDASSSKPCCTVTMANDAKRVCDKIGIPHYTLDMRDSFNKEVIDRFERDYLSGLTPNPCVQCNSRIKWGTMWDEVKALGFERLATGHYAQIKMTDDGNAHLLQGIDRTKDQSYFLWEIPADLLKVTLFPLGGLEKTDTRETARKFDLPVADKVESQEICFIPDDDYRSWLKERNNELGTDHSGDIVDSSGQLLGRHSGYPLFTIGQRKGLGLGGGARTLYVTSIDSDTKQVKVGDEGDLNRSLFRVGSLNKIVTTPLDKFDDIKVKIRYRSPAVAAKLVYFDDSSVTVQTEKPVQAVTPGQSAVFYRGNEVIAGGIIQPFDKD